MKRFSQIIFSSILLTGGIISVILFAQRYIQTSFQININNYNDLKGAYFIVGIIMGICAVVSLVWLIISLFIEKKNGLVKLNALSGLVISFVIMVIALITYADFNGKLELPENSLRATQYFSIVLSSLVFVPSSVGYVLSFSKK